VADSQFDVIYEGEASPFTTFPDGFYLPVRTHNIWWEPSKPGTGSVEKRMPVALPHDLDHRAEKSSYRLAARTDPAETQEG
jgi:hypothetical protein